MKYNRFSGYKIKKIIEHLPNDITAISTAEILKINRNTVNAYYNTFRESIFKHSSKETRIRRILSWMKAILEQGEFGENALAVQQGKVWFLAC